MQILTHIALFVLAGAIVWFFAGLLVASIDRISRRFRTSGFTVAFFVLGLLTSISELSVMINASLNGTPQVSAGNLVGASLVLLLFLVPLLAVAGKGIDLVHSFRKRTFQLALFVIALPALFLVDGDVRPAEGLIMFLAYGTLLYFIRADESREAPTPLARSAHEVKESLLYNRRTGEDALKIFLGAAFIFLAGHLLVEEAVFIANYFTVPASIIGLLILSIGTNIPELVVAAQSLLKKHKDIAFGDYMGSAAANTGIFAVLGLVNGRFSVERTEFWATFLLMIGGLVFFYIFARSKSNLSRKEGLILLGFYGVFVAVQIANFIRFAAD